MGPMRAVFKADRDETAGRYSVSEWWLEPRTLGPGVHEHPEDHVFYVIAGTLSLRVNDDWSHVTKGTYVVIPGGTEHEAWFREDTEVIDFFAPPRDDFLLGGKPAYMSEG